MASKKSRRSFIGDLGVFAVGLPGLSSTFGVASAQFRPKPLHLACSEYPWTVFYRREGRDFRETLDAGLGEIAAAGFDGYEPLVEEAKDLEHLALLLEKHSLEMRSLYVNSVLHEPDQANKSLDLVLSIAEGAKKLGTRIIVTNPSPIRWGGPQNKDDRQLEIQASALNRLGEELKKSGQILSYHNHDVELRQAAREFHHMLAGTDPDLVAFCLDAHWVYRGAGDSNVALFDVLKLYGPRVTELHIRQSAGGIWSESFGEGDIDYSRLVQELVKIGKNPHLVIEQAIERESPDSMNALEAHQKSARVARLVFAPLAS
jgi:inosose dehydratase